MPFLPPSQQRQSTEGILLDVVEQKVEVEAERRDEVDDVHGGHHERALARAHHEPTRHVTRHVTTAAAWRAWLAAFEPLMRIFSIAFTLNIL